jgi:hypothetical protein
MIYKYCNSGNDVTKAVTSLFAVQVAKPGRIFF